MGLQGAAQEAYPEGRLKKILRAIASSILGDYCAYKILTLKPGSRASRQARHACRRLDDVLALSRSDSPEIRSLAVYAQKEAIAFVAEEEGVIVAACWYSYGDTYKRRNFWPLQERQAKLVQITTAPSCRGKGVAQDLIYFSAQEMFKLGFEALYARVWHSHTASLRAFGNAGWKVIAWVIEIEPLGRKFRFCRRTG
jgi:L-amino acid N-acyltransferase YncA